MNRSPLVAETEHLIIRRFDTGDAAFVLALLNTPGWLRFIGDKNIHTLNDAENYIISGPVKSYKKHNFGLYLVQLKDEGESGSEPGGVSIGMCGLIKRDELEDVDIGFAFLPEYGGQGYAAEAVEAVLHHAVKDAKLNRIAAITLPNNSSCIRLLEKAGLRFERMIHYEKENETLMLFVKAL